MKNGMQPNALEKRRNQRTRKKKHMGSTFNTIWVVLATMGVCLLFISLISLLDNKDSLADNGKCTLVRNQERDQNNPPIKKEDVASHYDACVEDAEKNLYWCKYIAMVGGSFLAIALVMFGVKKIWNKNGSMASGSGVDKDIE